MKAKQKTLIEISEEANFHLSVIKMEIATALRIPQMVEWLSEKINRATALNNQMSRLNAICGRDAAKTALRSAKAIAKKEKRSVESVLIEFENEALRG